MNLSKRIIIVLAAALLCVASLVGCTKNEAITSSDGKYSLYVPSSYSITDKELNSLSVMEFANDRNGQYAVMLEYAKVDFENNEQFTEYFKEDLGYSYTCDFSAETQQLILNSVYAANSFGVTLKDENEVLYSQIYIIEAKEEYVVIIFFSQKPLKDKTISSFYGIASTFFEL